MGGLMFASRISTVGIVFVGIGFGACRLLKRLTRSKILGHSQPAIQTVCIELLVQRM